MKIRCLFQCTSVTKKTYGKDRFIWDAEFMPSYSPDAESKKFLEATPYGNLKIGAFNADLFEPGKLYYVDLIPVEEWKRQQERKDED